MTRNSRKLQRRNDHAPQSEAEKRPDPTPQPQAPSHTPDNPFGLSFVVPTEMVKLPTEGKFYPDSSLLHGVEEVEIKHMTAREEDLLSTVNVSNSDNVFDRLISGILIDSSLKNCKFIEEDKMAILLSARITGYGNEYKANSTCEACGESSVVTFDLKNRSVKHPDKPFEYDSASDCFELELPLTSIKVRARKLTERDFEELDIEKKKKEDLNLEFNRTISSLTKMVISANDITDKVLISKLIDVLPAADAKFLGNFDKNVYPQIDTTQEVECPKCNHSSEKEAPLSWAFFRTDI